jgi:hypothetical protein
MQILGTGIELTTVLYFLIFLFLLYGIWAYVSTGDTFAVFSKYNEVFFEGATVGESCGNIFNGAFSTVSMFEKSDNHISTALLGALIGIGIDFINTIITLLNIIGGVFLIIYRLFTDCGFNTVRLAVGWLIIIVVAFKIVAVANNANELLGRR